MSKLCFPERILLFNPILDGLFDVRLLYGGKNYIKFYREQIRET